MSSSHAKKFSDSADLVYLEGRFNRELKARNNEFSRHLLGMALKRYPHLEYAFTRLEVDMKACKSVAKDIDLEVVDNAPPEPNQVQNNLMFNLRAS